MANHRADGRPQVRKQRATGGTHCDATLPGRVVKVGVLGALATATIAAPLAAAAAGIDDAAPVADSSASLSAAASGAAGTSRAGGGSAQQAAAPVAIPDASDDAAQSDLGADATSGLEIDVPAPVTDENGEELAASSSGFLRPVGGRITSGYGKRVHPVLGTSKMHEGVDFGASCGTPVHASAAGEVVAVERHPASGNRVKIDHGDGIITGYYHLQGFNTSVGATVEQGDVIGYVGSTGRSTGCHLHFAKMDESGTYSNPMSLLK